MNPKLVKVSKFLSYVLRHTPDAMGLRLDDQGWADVQDLILQDLIYCAAQHGTFLDIDLLRETVVQNDKQRFAWNETHT